MTTSAMFCNHANEVPGWCTCSEDCYCKENTCRTKVYSHSQTLLMEYEIAKSVFESAGTKMEEARLRASFECVHPYVHCAVFVQNRVDDDTYVEGDYCMICRSRRLTRGHGPWLSRRQWNEFCEAWDEYCEK